MKSPGCIRLAIALTLCMAISIGASEAQEELGAAVANIERAAFWKTRGFNFNPHQMSAQEMDLQVEALSPLVYQREVGGAADQTGDEAVAKTERPSPMPTLDQVKAAAARATSGSQQRALLYGRGLRGMQSLAVKVSLTEASFRKPALWTAEGISEAQIKREIETTLEAAAIKVIPTLDPNSASLRVSARSIDTAYGSYEISVDMRLLDRVTIARSGVTTLAITWKDTLSGYFDKRHDASERQLAYLDDPRQLIRRGVNSLINDWLEANTGPEDAAGHQGGSGLSAGKHLIPEEALVDMAILISLDRQMMQNASSGGNSAVVSMGQSVLLPTLALYLAELGISPEKMEQRHSHLLKADAGAGPYTARFSYVDLPPLSLLEYIQAYSQWLQGGQETPKNTSPPLEVQQAGEAIQ